MRSIGALPKSVLILEILGMILLAAALLSLNQYLTLPAPMNSPLAVTVMIFLGILLMLPAAVALMWRIAQLIAATDDALTRFFFPFSKRKTA